jgi:cytochrome o ubiquinol oxidase subunit 1
MNLLGKLTWDAVPFHEPIIMGTMAVVGLGGAALLGWLTHKRAWPYLWTEWLTSVDHKRIGIMYMVLGS